ncbi:MAG: CcmD family protein [Dehalococcoidia bacterium]
MDNLEYLFAGFAVFWAGLFIYLLLLQTRIRVLNRQIEQLEERLAEADAAPPVEARPIPTPDGPRSAESPST